MELFVKYYITEDAARLTFLYGPLVTSFSIQLSDWYQLLETGHYVEHQETNMIINEDMHLKTWSKDGDRYIYFKFFETSIHAPLNAETDQNLWLFFNTLGKQ